VMSQDIPDTSNPQLGFGGGTVGLTVELAGLKSERSQTMTDTIDDVAAEAAGQEPVEPALDEQSVAEQPVAQAHEKGIELVGPDGLLTQLTKRVLETAPLRRR